MRFLILMILSLQCAAGVKSINRRWGYKDYKAMEKYHGLSKLDVKERIILVPKSTVITTGVPRFYIKAFSFLGKADSLPFNCVFEGDWTIEVEGLVLEQFTLQLNDKKYKIDADSVNTSETRIDGIKSANKRFVIQYVKGTLKVWTKIREKCLLEKEVGDKTCKVALLPNMEGLALGRHLFTWTRINVIAKIQEKE